jgi:hypothetical protein
MEDTKADAATPEETFGLEGKSRTENITHLDIDGMKVSSVRMKGVMTCFLTDDKLFQD